MSLRKYWSKIPPLGVLMAVVHGIKIGSGPGTQKSGEVIDARGMFEMIKAAGGKLRG